MPLTRKQIGLYAINKQVFFFEFPSAQAFFNFYMLYLSRYRTEYSDLSRYGFQG